MRFTQVFFLCIFVIISTMGIPASAQPLVHQGDELLRQANAPAASTKYSSQIRATTALRDFSSENLANLMRTPRNRLNSYVAYFLARRGLSEIDDLLGRQQEARTRRASDLEHLSGGILSFRTHADRLREKAINGGGMRALRTNEIAELRVMRSYLCLAGDNQMAMGDFQAAATSYLTAENYSHSSINHPSNYPGSDPSSHRAGGTAGDAKCYLWGQAYANFKLQNWPALVRVVRRVTSPVESERGQADYANALKYLTLQFDPRGVAPHQASFFEDVLFNHTIEQIVQKSLEDIDSG